VFAALCCLTAGTAAVPAFASGGSSSVVHATYLGPPNADRISLARSDANRLLSLAWFPAGARRLSTWVHLRGFELSEPAATIGDPDKIDIARFYLAGPKSQGVSWLNARPPLGGTKDGWGGPDRANLEWSYAFPSTAILQQSELQYSKRTLPDGNVEFRIDAQVAWTPVKSMFSIIPGGATLVKAMYSGSTQADFVSKRVSARTTNLSIIGSIRSQINALPVAYPGIESCPFVQPGSVTVWFFHPGHARAFATAFFASMSCGRVEVRQYSSMHELLGTGEDGGGSDAAPDLMKLLGLKNSI
jgi:hypothetical protein